MTELLRVENLVKHFPAKGAAFYNAAGALVRGSRVHALDGVSFSLRENSTLGLVGESGCGKSTLARALTMLGKPTSGRIFFQGADLTTLKRKELQKVRPKIQMVFQDPFSSLDPRMRAGDIIAEPLRVVTKDKDEIGKRVEEVFGQVGLKREYLDHFPNQFSGGQRQRIAIARAISTRPSLIILDEPTSALDASTQAQILNLLKDLQRQYSISYLFISHNINVVRYMSDAIAVMYLGKIVEMGEAKTLIRNPKHPYSHALISTVPEADPRRKVDTFVIKGETPSSLSPPPGCRYHPRCPRATDVCAREEPALVDMGEGRIAACHHPLDSTEPRTLTATIEQIKPVESTD